VGSCEHGNEPSGSINVGKFLSSCVTGGFSRRAQLHEVRYKSNTSKMLTFYSKFIQNASRYLKDMRKR
jgi:hypothetical protein